MQQPVEHRRRDHLVARQHLRPRADRLVARDAHRPAPVAVAHEPEEERRFFPAEGLKAHLVDDHERRLHVLRPLQSRRRPVGVLPHRVHQLFDAVERDRETALDRAHAQRDRQVRLSDAGRTEDQERLLLLDPPAGRQCLDPASLDRRLKREVEIADRLAGRKSRESKRPADAPLLAPRLLRLEQRLQEVRRALLVLDGLGEQAGERLGGKAQPQGLQSSTQAVKQNYKEFRKRNKTFQFAFFFQDIDKSALEVTDEERELAYEAAWKEGGLMFMGVFNDLLKSEEANATAQDFFRRKLSEVVTDPATAAQLMPVWPALSTMGEK